MQLSRRQGGGKEKDGEDKQKEGGIEEGRTEIGEATRRGMEREGIR
jgi:hypothetical protein